MVAPAGLYASDRDLAVKRIRLNRMADSPVKAARAIEIVYFIL